MITTAIRIESGHCQRAKIMCNGDQYSSNIVNMQQSHGVGILGIPYSHQRPVPVIYA